MGKSEDRVLERQQNRVRGALGQTRRHFQKTSTRGLHSRFEIRRALLDARKDLPRSLRAEFFEWLNRLRTGLGASLEQALLQDLSNAVIKTAEIDVSSELEWIGYRLASFIPALKQFRTNADRLNEAFWSEDADACLALLNQIHVEHGDALWLINASVAIKQHFVGLEAQKDYIEEVRKRYPGGLPAYLAFFTSVRNEQRATVALFDEDLSERLNEAKLSEDLKAYLGFKLAGRFNCTDAAVSAVLRAEQSQSVIDLYETTIEVMQRCLTQRNSVQWRTAAVSTLKKLTSIGDFRIEKLLFGFTGELNAGRIATGPGAAAPDFEACLPEAFWTGVWRLVSSGDQWSREDRSSPLLAIRLRALFGSLLARDTDFEDSRARTSKFARNLSFLPSVRAIGDFYDFVSLRTENAPKQLGAVSLNSSSFTGADILYVDDDVLQGASEALQAIVTPREVAEWAGLSDPEHGPSVQPVAWFARVLRLRVSDADLARDLIAGMVESGPADPIRGLISNLDVQLALEGGDLNRATTLISRAVARNRSTVMIMPAQDAIGGRTWDALSTVPDKLDLAITLLAYWRQTDDGLHATYLRFAFEEVLAQLGVSLPGDLSVEALTSDDRILLFASDICIPVLMDTSGLFVSSAELFEERTRTLINLINADPENKDEYVSEAADLRLQKLIRSGLEIVDSNRVSVDMDALGRWANKRYRESYLRYQALRAAGVGVSASFEEVVESVKRQSHPEGEYFSIPKNEADTLLLEIILALQKQFLTDTQYGLEYFLGKRIRHGTIAGHMRGPVEARSLITERRSAQSPYEPNIFWLERMGVGDKSVNDSVVGAFDRFSEQYDNLIAEVRDRYLHVKSGDHPDGLFEIVVSSAQYHIIRSLAGDIEFDVFLSVVLNSFWSLLSPSLTAAKEFLSGNIKGQVVHLFAELQTTLQYAVPDDPYRNVSIAIQETSAEVQRELDTVAGWFDRVESKHASHTFTLEEVVEVGIQSALKSLTNFEPTIERSIDGTLRATAAVLIMISDTLFVVLDNVYRRAKAGYQPDISISCSVCAEDKTLTILSRNPIGEDVDRDHLSRRLESFRAKIAAGDIASGAAADKGSGLLKIASMTRDYRGAVLEFGVDDEQTFTTKVILPVFITDDRFSLLPRDVE